MALSKIKTIAVAVVALLAVGGATSLVIQHNRSPAGDRRSLTQQDEAAILRLIESMNARALSTAPPYVYVRPTRTPGGHQGAITMNGRIMGRGVRTEQLLAAAYGTSESRVRPKPGVALPTERYSYVISLNSGQQEALQKTLREQLGLTARPVKRTEPVYLLKSRAGQFGGRNPASEAGPPNVRVSDGELFFESATVSVLVRSLERVVRKPIVDETGLQGRFDFLLNTPELGADQPNLTQLQNALGEQIGFDLQPAERQVEMWVVEK
jgi:uncharacterized protein (TIGR03435 family)